MEPPNDRRDKAPSRYPMPPSKTSGAGNGLYFIVSAAKGPHGNPQTSQANSYSLYPHGKSLLLKTQLIYVIKSETLS